MVAGDGHEGVGMTCCSLCGEQTRSLYVLPGDTKVRMCATCFFGQVLQLPETGFEQGDDEARDE